MPDAVPSQGELQQDWAVLECSEPGLWQHDRLLGDGAAMRKDLSFTAAVALWQHCPVSRDGLEVVKEGMLSLAAFLVGSSHPSSTCSVLLVIDSRNT